jgi:anthranilate synthase/aminodeoxychorismate synthase-like glutamine amidotransferase
MMILIDNYDSFTYNLYQYLAEIGVEVHVVRNDAITLAELKRLQPTRVMISPGPGDPTSAGVSVEAIRYFAGRVPVLGVCLGHQSLAYAFGGEIIRAKNLMHGKTSPIHHDRRTIFANMPEPFEATRYHSLVVKRESLSQDFEISAWTEESGGYREIMGLRHLPTGAEGVQFHPESILTQDGMRLLEAFAK